PSPPPLRIWRQATPPASRIGWRGKRRRSPRRSRSRGVRLLRRPNPSRSPEPTPAARSSASSTVSASAAAATRQPPRRDLASVLAEELLLARLAVPAARFRPRPAAGARGAAKGLGKGLAPRARIAVAAATVAGISAAPAEPGFARSAPLPRP